MITNFVKAVTFTRLIKAGGRLREFNFRKFKKEDQELFSVDRWMTVVTGYFFVCKGVVTITGA